MLLQRERKRKPVIQPLPEDLGRNACLHRLFEEQVERLPNAIALVFGNRHVTYRDLNKQANRLARRLRREGVGAESIVAILAERSIEMIVAMLAVLKAGGGYLPLAPELPAGRLQVVLADARPALLLAGPGLAERITDSGIATLVLDNQFSQEGDENLPNLATPENLAYVIYTSGSTGTPKGVVNTHGGICNFVKWLRRQYQLGPSDRVLQRTAFTFDPSLGEIFGALCHGSRLVIAGPAQHGNVEALIDLMQKQRVTMLWLVPSLLKALLRHEDMRRCTSLRFIVTGGESLSHELQQQHFSVLPRAELHNVYGPTETVVAVTAWTCAPGVQNGSIPIGKPIDHTTALILDQAMRLVEAGQEGELYIGGDQVARGYLRRPDLTAERFIKNPFGEGRLYRTGDLCRRRPDGAIQFIERADRQVKLRGYRIETEEIEALLKKFPGVQDCVVLVRAAGSEDNQVLVAYVVTASVSGDELRAHAQKFLPAYMVPTTFCRLAALPLTPNGKIDRNALPEPAALNRVVVAPRSPAESEMAALWEKVLGVSQVSVSDNFFELGGNSLNALEVFRLIRQRSGLRLPLSLLLANPTIEQLVAAMQDQPGAVWNPLVPLQTQGDRIPFFGIHGQDGNVLFYRVAARTLGAAQPFYALQAQGADGSDAPERSIEETSKIYLDQIRKVQPAGPYMVGGYSFGGCVAYEIARRLREQGEEVALLMLFDTANPQRSAQLVSLREKLKAVLRDPTAFTPHRILQFLAHRTGGKMAAVFLKTNEILHACWAMICPSTEERNALVRLQMTHQRALLNYNPKPYNGKVTLLRAKTQAAGYARDYDLGWGPLAADGVEVRWVPGNHYTIFDPENAPGLAAELGVCIQNAHLHQPLPPSATPGERTAD